jgi:hypothetical protein
MLGWPRIFEIQGSPENSYSPRSTQRFRFRSRSARRSSRNAEGAADHSARATCNRAAEGPSRSLDAQERRRSGVPEQVGRTSPRNEAVGARATTGGGTRGARADDVASVPPHSFVAAQRSPRAGEDRQEQLGHASISTNLNISRTSSTRRIARRSSR